MPLSPLAIRQKSKKFGGVVVAMDGAAAAGVAMDGAATASAVLTSAIMEWHHPRWRRHFYY